MFPWSPLWLATQYFHDLEQDKKSSSSSDGYIDYSLPPAHEISEEEAARREAMPHAVRHFTPYDKQESEKTYEKTPVPIAVQHFTPPIVPKEDASMVDRTKMPIAVQKFTPEYQPKEKVEYKPDPMPAAMEYFTTGKGAVKANHSVW